MMKERLTELQERVQSARAALEALAERATELRARLEAARPPEDPFSPVGPGTPLASSLDRLTQGVRTLPLGASYDDGDDGRFVSDAWEIALINEEGK